MGFFKSEVRDPELGPLTKSIFGPWKGTIKLADNDEVEARIPGSAKEPDPAAVAALRQLPSRLARLQEEIQVRLFEHYEPYREAMELGEDVDPRRGTAPRLNSPAEAWAAAKPVRVVVETTTPAARLEIAFEVPWDEEHVVGVTLEDWRVVDFSGSVAP